MGGSALERRGRDLGRLCLHGVRRLEVGLQHRVAPAQLAVARHGVLLQSAAEVCQVRVREHVLLFVTRVAALCNRGRDAGFVKGPQCGF